MKTDRATRLAINAAVSATYEDASGAVSNRELIDAVSSRAGIPREAFDSRAPVGRSGTQHSLLQRTVRWHQQTLRHLGLLEREPDSRGVWRKVKPAKEELSEILPGKALLVFSTKLGLAVWADCRTLFDNLGTAIDLTITSPPFCLAKPRAYGNPPASQYVDFVCEVLEPIVRWLKPGGAVCLNLSNSTREPGSPARSLCRERLIIALHDRLGLATVDELVWENPTKPPGPVQWASKTRQLLNNTWEPIYLLTNDPHKFAGDNRRVLLPHTPRHERLMQSGGERREVINSDGAYRVRAGSYGKLTPGRIPRNVLSIPHRCVDQQRYKAAARAIGLPVHGAPFPRALSDFLVRYLTKEGDLVVDPMAGSLTVGASAESLGRRWICTDVMGEYVRGGAERFRRADGFEWGPHMPVTL